MANTKKQQTSAAQGKQTRKPSQIADKDLDAVTGGLRPRAGTDPCVS